MKKLKFYIQASTPMYLVSLFLLIGSFVLILISSNALSSYFQLKKQFQSNAANTLQLVMEQKDETIENVLFEVAEMDLISYHVTPIQDNHFKALFYSDANMIDDFIAKNRVIIDGNMLGESFIDNGCLISDELARANHLRVGSTLTFLHQENWNISLYFRVVGIFKDYTSSSSESRRNEIIINYDVYEKLIERYTALSPILATHTLYIDASQDPSMKKIGISGDICYKDALLVMDGYVHFASLILLGGCLLFCIAFICLKKKVVGQWQMIHQFYAKLQMKCSIEQNMLCFTAIISTLIASFIHSATYDSINQYLLRQGIRYDWVFTQNSNGFPIEVSLHPYYQGIEQLLNPHVQLISFAFLLIFILALFQLKNRRTQ